MAPTVSVDLVGESKCSFVDKPMGKSRKFSKSQFTGFVPEYRHAVGTMVGSEGLGSSGRAEMEMTVSDDSCGRKRKSISLNVGGNEQFDVPMKVLSLSKMSKLERKDLAFKLKKELEQLRTLRNRLTSFGCPEEILSPSSDLRRAVDGFKRSSVLSAGNSKKHGISGRNSSSQKKGRVEVAKALDSVPIISWKEQCRSLLSVLMSHQFSWVFNTPVDVVKLNIPDYHKVIKHPMDLGTVKGKLASGKYSNPLEFVADVRLTFSNAKKYNPPGNDVHFMADKLSKFFEYKWKAVEKKIPAENDAEQVHQGDYGCLTTETSADTCSSKKKKVSPHENGSRLVPLLRKMTDEEKHKLSTDLMDCIGDLPPPIIDFLKTHCPSDGDNEDDEIELDIDALEDDVLFKLRKLLNEHLSNKQKKLAKAEPCEIELLNDSGISNLSLHPEKENEEKIDVGIDPPVSKFFQVEIERNAGPKQSKSTSSSSSSSDSDSSSECTSPNVREKQSIQETSMAEELCVNQEGENAPPERRVSPDKAYRAAILRSRFADTILRAREKALEKGEKRDPEILRIQREELERCQKEERARLQADAKAAEEARKKAEADAAAEAKRKRELEREAARQALLQMEKSVDINEHGGFMDDLEMFRCCNDEKGESFVEEMSPDDSQNGVGSFKLQVSSNPLEQLGLYMKADEEEEDEGELPGNDVEEGEID